MGGVGVGTTRFEVSTESIQATLDKAIAFVKTQQQPDGSFGRGMDKYPAVTALALRGLVQDKNNPYSSDAVHKGYDWLLKQRRGAPAEPVSKP